MAQFYAVSEVDLVGSMDPLPIPTVGSAPITVNNFAVVNSTEYYNFNVDSTFIATPDIKSWSHLKYTAPYNNGIGETDQVWKADSGDSYSLLDLIAILVTPSGTDPTKTAFTEQDFNQFFFEFNDRIHGSEEDDMLCGWAGNDRMWGNGGNNKFYFGQGMDKDKIMDFSKANDDLYLDEDFASTFKQLKKMVTYNTNKNITKIKDGGDVLKVYGIDTQKELKSVVHFDDFTDFA